MSGSLYKKNFYPWAPGLVDIGGAVPADPAVGCRTLRNMTPTDAGTTEIRGGVRPFQTFLTFYCQRVAGLFSGRFKSLPGDDFVVVSNDTFNGTIRRQEHYLFGSGYTYATPVSGGSLEPSLYESKYGTTPDYVVVGDKLFIASPGVGILSVTASGARGNRWQQERGIPSASYISTQGYRLWIGRTEGYEDSVFGSVPGDPENFSLQDGAVRVGISDRSGRPVTALSGSFYGSLYAFTEDSISRVRANSPIDIEREQVSDTIGAISNGSVIQVNNDLVFASLKGLHSLITTQKYGDVEEKFLSAPIQRIWNQLSPESLRDAKAAWYPAKSLYLLCVRDSARLMGGAYDTKILVLHVPSGRWSVWDVQAEAICVSSRWGWGAAAPIIGAGTIMGAAGVVSMIDAPDRLDFTQTMTGVQGWPTSGTTGYDAVVETHWIDCGDPSANKNFRAVEVVFESGASQTAKLRWLIDDQFNATDPDVRDKQEKTFYLNPSGENMISKSPGTGSSLNDSANTFLARTHDTPCVARVGLFGSGRRIKLELLLPGGVDDSGRPTGGYSFNLIGFVLHYLVENEAGSGHRMDQASDVTETVFAYASPAPVPVTVGVGDGPETP